MMNINNFSLSTNWKVSQERDYLVDTSSKELYPFNTEKEMKGKSGMLAVASPFAHTALGIGNMAIRFFRLVSFYNFWKKDETEKEYSFKARVIETGKDAARLVSQPFGIIALEIISLVGIFKPFDSMKLYCQLEKALYGRPFMAQMIDFVPLKAEEEDTTSRSKSTQEQIQTSSEEDLDIDIDPENGDGMQSSKHLEVKKFKKSLSDDAVPFTPPLTGNLGNIKFDEIPDTEDDTSETSQSGSVPELLDIGEEDIDPLPSLAERIAEVIEDISIRHLRKKAEKCAEEIADHVLLTYQESENFDAYIDEQIRITRETIGREFNPSWVRKEDVLSKIAGKMIPVPAFKGAIDFDQVNEDLLEIYIGIPSIKDKLVRKIDIHLETCDLSDLKNNGESFYKLSRLVNQYPELRTEAYKAKEQEIVDRYVTTFKEICDTAAGGKVNRELGEKACILQILLQTIQDDELIEGILIKLVQNKFNWDHLDRYLAHVATIPGFNVDGRSMMGALTNARSVSSVVETLKSKKEDPNIDKKTLEDLLDKTLENFPDLVDNILKFLPKKDPKNPYLEFFRIQIRMVIEDLARAIHDPLQLKEFNLHDEEDSRLNRSIQETVQRINEEFDLDIELKIKMKTEQDPLIAAKESLKISLPIVFGEVGEAEVEAWLIGKDDRHRLQEFAQWLANDNYCGTLNMVWDEQYQGVDKTIDHLHAIFLAGNS